MPKLKVRRSRLITEKIFSFVFIHNQSCVDGDLDPDTKTVPSDQANDANALMLATKHDILVTSLPISQNYLKYWSETLKLSVPHIYVPKVFKTDLLTSVLESKEDFVQFVKKLQQEGHIKEQLILSVFVAEERDKDLLKSLQDAGLPELESECSYDLLRLGNKDGFRDFCTEHKVTQLPGGNFSNLEELEDFINKMHQQNNTVVIKSPTGIGGSGQIRLRPNQAAVLQEGEDKTKLKDWRAEVKSWLSKEKYVEAEQFADNAESEHVVDVYIDPTDVGHHSAVVFDQLVRNDDDSAGLRYYGAKYPSKNVAGTEKILADIESTVAPALHKVGFRGPAGIDVLWNPLHFMELNMRTDAITYIKHVSDRIGKHLYNSKPGTTAFMTLVNLKHEKSFEELLKEHADVFAQHDDGVFVFSNPNRQRWGFYDVIAISPHDLATAERVMERSLKALWGEESAQKILGSIYQPKK